MWSDTPSREVVAFVLRLTKSSFHIVISGCLMSVLSRMGTMTPNGEGTLGEKEREIAGNEFVFSLRTRHGTSFIFDRCE